MTRIPAVRVELGERSYDVLAGEGAADALLDHVASTDAGRIAVVAAGNVFDIHGEAVIAGLDRRGKRSTVHRLPPGEQGKSLPVVGGIIDEILSEDFERRDLVLGLGGGAATDVAGFVASLLLRGVRWVVLPTSLLGQVDAAVGGKTGVNVRRGKNLVGTFHQPRAVGCDTGFLATLPAREFRAGMAEVVKTAWIGDPSLFEALERDPPKDASHPRLPETIRRCIAVKADIVSQDEREAGRRASLNFGHTLGHAIETESGMSYLHGECVSLGMVAALHISVETGRCEASLLERLLALLEDLGLPVRDPSLDTDAILARTRADKKRREGGDRYQLTRGLGFVSVARDLPAGAPRAAIEFLRR